MEHIWTILMLKILHAHLLRTFIANLKIDAIYALYPESLSDKYLAVRKVFAFSDSDPSGGTSGIFMGSRFDLSPTHSLTN